MRMTRAQQKARTSEQILQVAAEVFDTKGYTAASISDIAEKLGMTKGILYHHYPSKADLAAQVAAGYFKMWGPIQARLDSDPDLRGFDALRWVSMEIAKRYREDVFVRASVRLIREQELIDAEMPTPFVGWIQMATYLLGQAQEDGRLRPGVDIEQAAWYLVASFYGVQDVSYQLTNREDVVERVGTMWDLILPGLEAA